MKAADALRQAADIVDGPRQETHGDYVDQATRIGILWGVLLDRDPIPPRTVAAMMVALKVARATAGRPHADDWLDMAGYAALGCEIDQQ